MPSLRNVHVFSAPAGTSSDVHFSDGHLVSAQSDDVEIDCGGMTVCPGFVDIQVNGGWSHDFSSDPQSIWDVGSRLPETGVTSFLPTIVTSPPDIYAGAIEAVVAGPPAEYRGAEVLGLHFEGPWLSPEYAGAHSREHLAEPDLSQAVSWADSGVVRIVTMAPELKGAATVAAALAEAGVVVSMGHTGADYEIAKSALAGPWSATTHLFNQMSGFDHRAPGAVAAALTANAWTGIIADGLHVAPGALELAATTIDADRLILITDSMAATGLAHGEFLLGEKEVVVNDSGPRLPDGRLAGSTLTMNRAVAILARDAGVDRAEAIVAATANPASLLRAEDRGTLASGMRADLVLMDDSSQIAGAIIAGQVLFGPGS